MRGQWTTQQDMRLYQLVSYLFANDSIITRTTVQMTSNQHHGIHQVTYMRFCTSITGMAFSVRLRRVSVHQVVIVNVHTHTKVWNFDTEDCNNSISYCIIQSHTVFLTEKTVYCQSQGQSSLTYIFVHAQTELWHTEYNKLIPTTWGQLWFQMEVSELWLCI